VIYNGLDIEVHDLRPPIYTTTTTTTTTAACVSEEGGACHAWAVACGLGYASCYTKLGTVVLY